MITTTITKQKNGQIEESLERVIVPRIKRNLAEMERLATKVTEKIRIAIGKDLLKAKRVIDDRNGSWPTWLKENFYLSETTANRYLYVARRFLEDRSTRFTSITEKLRDRDPNYARPRQKVDEEPIRNILAGINADVLLDRERSEKKENRLKKLVALELVEAGYRALSHKVHSDKGGSDDAMRRLTEVQKALKAAIKDDLIGF